MEIKTLKDSQMDATLVHTGGHKRSSGNAICIPKSRFKRLMVSCLLKCQGVVDVMGLHGYKHFTAAGSLKSSWLLDLRL